MSSLTSYLIIKRSNRLLKDVPSFKSFKQRALKILSDQYIQMSSLILDHLNSQLLFMMYQCTKFDVRQAESPKDIEWSANSYGQCKLTFDLKSRGVFL
jgi:hypothetical protein